MKVSVNAMMTRRILSLLILLSGLSVAAASTDWHVDLPKLIGSARQQFGIAVG